MDEEFRKKIEETLDIMKWQQYTSGQVDGALAVLRLLDIPYQEKEDILCKAVGVSHMTAKEFLAEGILQKDVLHNN